MPPHRCIDGGAGVDGCPPRPWFEQLGRDPTWRLAVVADEGGSFGLRGAVACDAALHRSVSNQVAVGLGGVAARVHVDAEFTADLHRVLGDRGFRVSPDSGSSRSLWVESDIGVSRAVARPGELGSRLPLPRAESTPGLLDVLFAEESRNGRLG